MYPKTTGRPRKTEFNGVTYVRNARDYYHPLGGGQALHRTIWEAFCKCTLPADWQVHHIDGNALNNDPVNLEALPERGHAAKHHRLNWTCTHFAHRKNGAAGLAG